MPSIARINNFRQVTSWLYRGGQPDPISLHDLKEMGIKTIVCLRWGRRLRNEEEKSVLALGMAFESIPMHYLWPPGRKACQGFLDIVDNLEKHPIFLHCLHGSDRTGLMVAIYRMAREGWSAEEAYQEMRQCGFHWIRVHHFKWSLFRFARENGIRLTQA